MTPEHEQIRSGLAMLVGQATRQWRRAVDRRLQPFGLSEATWRPLLHLARAPAPMRQKELAASLGLDGSSVVRLLDALQAAGFIERREEEADRRARAILLTPEGRALVARVEDVSRAVRNDGLAGLEAAEIETAHRVLARICRNLAETTEDAAP
ncbi:MarR family winged helix-turn-helix transcriptional regulator [Pseudoroseomonas ludipueritiae]|uniref:MarR family transcriptional regulator n=1 Tax=Pseudoroseomonas ludipueritiae TaxID=198093 RepID=A0ABR7RFD0_9PROT|nr:MarR family transcriptional regulator [Pseudoroseomonas ludipueritiae]MBC9180135.1 MarR family transcriptional regulator [Pseudoroseomonas ludipueritiae]MCG7360836.1 MarR family transcriptional regulator [Roseomonas sp. ACRSG]